jgi:hypothetical protein
VLVFDAPAAHDAAGHMEHVGFEQRWAEAEPALAALETAVAELQRALAELRGTPA